MKKLSSVLIDGGSLNKLKIEEDLYSLPKLTKEELENLLEPEGVSVTRLEAGLDAKFKKLWSKYIQLREQSDKFEEKITVLNDILEIDSENFLAWFEKGRWLGESGKHKEALKCFEKTTELKPDRVLGWANRGYALDLLGKNEESLEYFDKAIELDPNNFLPWEYKGMALGNLGKFEEAIKCFDKAVEIDPKNILSWFRKGVAFHSIATEKMLGQSEISKEELEDLLKRQSENAIKCFDEAINLINMSDAGASVISYVQETQPFLVKIKLYLHKGITLVILHRPEEAIKCFDKVIELEPQDAQIWYLKSVALQELEKHEEANKCFEHALDLGFEPPKQFLYKQKLDGLNEDEEKQFQDNEEKLEEEEFKKETHGEEEKNETV